MIIGTISTDEFPIYEKNGSNRTHSKTAAQDEGSEWQRESILVRNIWNLL